MSNEEIKPAPSLDSIDMEDTVVLNKSDAEQSDAAESDSAESDAGQADTREVDGDNPEISAPDFKPINTPGSNENYDVSHDKCAKLSEVSIGDSVQIAAPKPDVQQDESEGNTGGSDGVNESGAENKPDTPEAENTWPEYTIPKWFLVHNVQTLVDVKATQPPFPIIFKPANESEDSSEDEDEDTTNNSDSTRETNGSPNAQREGLEAPGYEIPEASFSELRDVIAAAFVRDGKGKLSTSCVGALVHGPLDEFSPFTQGMLQRVAKDLGASLVSVTRDDLMDLGWEFDRQDKARADADEEADAEAEIASERDFDWDASSVGGDDDEDKGRTFLSELGNRYFSSRHGRPPQDDWYRARSAFNALLDSHLAKSKPTESNPAIIHMHDCFKILHKSSWSRVLNRLSQAVRYRRTIGQPIVLVGSIVDRSSGNECCANCKNSGHIPGQFQTNVAKVEDEMKMGSPGSSTVALYPKCVWPKGAIRHSDIGCGVRRAVNIRQLKRALRDQIPHLFTPEVLHELLEPSTAPRARGFEDEDCEMGEFYWNRGQIRRAVAQMAGRALGKSHVDLDDVKAVLLRLGLIKKKTEKPKSEESKSETWAERIKRVRQDANEHEEDIIDNIINPDDIDCTFDDVVMDPATKDHLRHLIALSTTSSTFKPVASSRFLQKQLRLNGTLLFGPPGTGKTHLSSAIAKSSSASFISLDAATIQHCHVGESEKTIKAAFTVAAKLHPCVLFFDEVDALFYRRASTDKSWERSVLAQFLTEMDGINKSDKAPFVIVATNRPQDLDEAFYRRLPNKVYFKLPGEEARKQILEGLVKGNLDGDDGAEVGNDEKDGVDTIESLARQTVGYSGSDLKNLCAEAALIWAVERVKEYEAAQRKEKEKEEEEKNEEEKKEEDIVVEVKGLGDGDKAKVKDKEVKEERVKLTVAHFAKALKKVRPSVSPVKEKGFQEFMRRFCPGSI